MRPLHGSAQAECRVARVIDGDTVVMACPGREAVRARLTGFDTPELSAPGCAAERVAAQRAKAHLQRLLRRADEISMVRSGTDRYGRALVEMRLDGQRLSALMIDAGLARAYTGGQRAPWCGSDLLARL